MEPVDIKKRKEELFDIIERSNEELKKIREGCTHPETEEVNWSWRVGCCDRARICAICGEFIEYTGGPALNIQGKPM